MARDEVEAELEGMDTTSKEPKNVLTGDDFSAPLKRLISKNAISVQASAPVRDAVALMKDNGVGAVVALEEGVVVGILTERDILRALGEMVEGVLKQPVSELMTRDPVSLREDDAIAYVAHNMQLGGYRHVPIVDDDGRPVSIVSIKDVVRYVLSYFPEEVLNTVPEPYRGEPKVHGG